MGIFSNSSVMDKNAFFSLLITANIEKKLKQFVRQKLKTKELDIN